MARRAGGKWRLRIAGAVLLVAILAGVYGWWYMQNWRPDRAAFPVQGVEIGDEDGAVNWRSLKAIGAQFAYLDASASAFAHDSAFSENLSAARAAGLQVGAVHRYDPCQPADSQAANFVTVVPRDKALLPPAVELFLLADECPVKVGDAEVESELTTFINRIETHTGKPVILKLTPQFQKRYTMASRIDRNLWLVGDRVQPDYAGRPWTLWTANSAYRSDVSDAGLHWLAVQP